MVGIETDTLKKLIVENVTLKVSQHRKMVTRMATHIAPPIVAGIARRALWWRREYGRGGTSVGVRRAIQLANSQKISENTIKRMWSYFRRHEVDKKSVAFFDGPKFPSAGRIAWDLWGGDQGYDWVRKILDK